MFPEPSPINIFGTRKGISICVLKGSTDRTYTITSTDKTAMGLSKIDGIFLIGTDAEITTGGTAAAVTVGYSPRFGDIIVNGTPTYKPITIAVIGRPVMPKQNNLK
jgi:hypothetical protein